MEPTERCHHRNLAKSGEMQIDRCSCGMLHVTFGPFTVRMPVHALERLASVIAIALSDTRPPEVDPVLH